MRLLVEAGKGLRKRTLLKILDLFAKSYVPEVSVRFAESNLRWASGQSDLEKRIIYVSTRQELLPDAIGLGMSYAYRIGPKYRSMKLNSTEMYFLTLLHEIGHFKIKEQIPQIYLRLRYDIFPEGGFDHDRLIELSYIENRLKRKKSEKLSAWKLRLADFMSWLATGETISHHMKVENWAIDEFERKRKTIAKLLSEAGF